MGVSSVDDGGKIIQSSDLLRLEKIITKMMSTAAPYSSYGYGKYYAGAYSAIVSFIITVIILYYLLTGRGERLDVGWFLAETSPYMWASIGVGLSVSVRPLPSMASLSLLFSRDRLSHSIL